jgi:hypothetical protein
MATLHEVAVRCKVWYNSRKKVKMLVFYTYYRAIRI